MAPCVPAGRRQGNCMKNDGKPRLDSRRPYGANFSLYGRIPRSALRFSWAIFGSSLRDDEPRLIEGSPKRTCSVNKNIHAIALFRAGAGWSECEKCGVPGTGEYTLVAGQVEWKSRSEYAHEKPIQTLPTSHPVDLHYSSALRMPQRRRPRRQYGNGGQHGRDRRALL